MFCIIRNAKGRNYDPIDFEDFNANETWFLYDEPSRWEERRLGKEGESRGVAYH